MKVTTAQLNEVARILNTTDKNLVFSATIKTLVDCGLAVNVAFDAVFGSDAWNQFAEQVQSDLTA